MARERPLTPARIALGVAAFLGLAVLVVTSFVVGCSVLYEGLDDSDAPAPAYEDAPDPDVPRRERVVRSGPRGWPPGDAGPDETAPGTPPAPEPPVVRGRVVGPDQAPVAGVLVFVAGMWARTDAEGGFSIQPEEGRDDLEPRVLAPGFCLQAAPEQGGDGRWIVHLAEDDHVDITGVVSGDEGRPVSGARVRAEPYRVGGSDDAIAEALRRRGGHERADEALRALSPETTTTADGTFSLRVPKSALHVIVSAHADGFAPGHSEPVHLLQDSDWHVVGIRLFPVIDIRGRVLDATTLLPVAGAVVASWVSQQGEPDEDAVTTGPDGTFRLDGARWPTLYVLADDYLRAHVSLRKDETDVEIRIHARRPLAGRVQLTDGTPVEGAYVDATGPTPAPRGLRGPGSVWTNANGEFRIENAWDASFTVSAVVTDRAKTSFLGAEIQTVGGDERIVIVVRRAREIHGRVVTADGEPVHLAYVTCRRDGGAGRPGDGGGDSTDRDGRFELRGLADGSFRVSVGPAVGHASVLPAHREDVAAGAGDVVLTVSLGATLAGRVVDEEGAPVAGREVLAIDPDTVGLAYHSGHAAKTDADGRFEIAGLEKRPYRLQLHPFAPEWDRCYLEGAERLDAGATGLELRLSTGGEISGTVVDASGAPVPDTEVQAVPVGEPTRIESRTVTDAEGRFTIRRLLRTRRYTIHATGAQADDIPPGTTTLRLQR